MLTFYAICCIIIIIDVFGPMRMCDLSLKNSRKDDKNDEIMCICR